MRTMLILWGLFLHFLILLTPFSSNACTTFCLQDGSITFNQVGKEFPHGGMNEAGLIIELMWHQDARYPESDDRSGLSELQWIQYQLDNSATVEGVLKSDQLLRISSQSVATIHMLIEAVCSQVDFLKELPVEFKTATAQYPQTIQCAN